MNISLLIISIFLVLALYLGIKARKGKDMDMEQFAVGAGLRYILHFSLDSR